MCALRASAEAIDLAVVADGFFPEHRESVRLTGDRTTVHIRLRRGVEIRGQVVDGKVRPLGGAEVFALARFSYSPTSGFLCGEPMRCRLHAGNSGYKADQASPVFERSGAGAAEQSRLARE